MVSVLFAASFAVPGIGAVTNARALHTSSSFYESSDGMAVTMVDVSSGELPTMPTWAGGATPTAIANPTDQTTGGTVQTANFNKPDGAFTVSQADPATCSQQITVTGEAYGWDDQGRERPLSFATAAVWDIDTVIIDNPVPYVTITFKGSTLVGEDGYFSFGPICNQDGIQGGPEGTLDIAVSILPTSSAAKVVRDKMKPASPSDPCLTGAFGWQFSDWLYAAWFPQVNNAPDGPLNLGSRILPRDTRVSDAFVVYSLYSGVLAGWDLVRNRVGVSYSPQQVEVHHLRPYDCWGNPAQDAEPFSHYMVADSGCGWTGPFNLFGPDSTDCSEHWDDFWSQIHIDNSISAKNPFVVNHLYAHYVAQQYHNGWYPSSNSRYAGDFDEYVNCNSPGSYQLYCDTRFWYDYRNFDSTYGTRIAWAEGFADVFALAAMESRPGGAPTSSFTYQRSPIDPNVPNSPWTVDLESASTLGVLYKERTVAAALNDIMDSGVDGIDNYAGGFSRIWQAFTQSQQTTLQPFWNDWFSLFHSQHLPGQTVNPILGAQRSMRQNGFLPAETTLTASEFTASSWVSLTWTKADEADFAKYEIHRSTTPGFTPTSSTLAATITDQADKDHIVTGLNCATTYTFEVVVHDTAAWRAASNKVQATTLSCGGGGGGGSPFVAPWNGTDYEVDNNILPLSEVFDRETVDVADYYRLAAPLVPKDGTYSLKIVEFEEEHSFFDSVALWVVDHDPDVRIGVDAQTGEIFTYEDPESPEWAVDNYGRDVSSPLLAWDGLVYEGWRGDTVELHFGAVHRDQALLVVVADTPKLKTRIYIQVWNGTDWETADTMHHRALFAEDIIDLSDYVPAAELRIRLVGASRFSLDQVGLHTGPPMEVDVERATLLEAIHSSGEDVAGFLSQVDGLYGELVPGEEILLTFTMPTVEDEARSFIFVSHGHYTHKYQPLQGTDLSIDGLNVSFQAVIPDAAPGQYWDIAISGLSWDLGDGTTAAGTMVSHRYERGGEYVITVRILYTDGAERLYQRVIIVFG